jgi:signal transduction histidine kinase
MMEAGDGRMTSVARQTAIGERLHALWWSLVLGVLSVFGLALFVVTVVGISVAVVTVGILMLAICLPLLRRLADFHRRWASARLATPIASPYRPLSGNVVSVLWQRVKDPTTWRDLLWLFYNSSIGFVIYLVAIVYGTFALVLWWLPANLLLDVNARAVRRLLAPSRSAMLAGRVTELAESRAETVGTQAAEIRRIERDLHDGAQARLVALSINLGMAEQLLEADPAAARELVAEARASTSQALTELRDLVRGIHPPVLADRGLVGAVQALALSTPIEVEVAADVTQPLPAPAESAGYFAMAEVLTNVIKHSGASHAAIMLHYDGTLLRMRVIDDGVGGALIEAGTGLRGIERRLAAFDGTLVVTSPPGGPTTVTMELPCASSSPKTMPSSVTD